MTKELHPAVADLLRYFECDHLPEPLQVIAKPIRALAHEMAARLDGPQLSHGLHSLLQAKDSFVRAALPLRVGTVEHVVSFEHDGDCASVEHPAGFGPGAE